MHRQAATRFTGRVSRVSRLLQYGLVFLGCVALAAGVLAQGDGAPKIELPVENVDLGEVDRGAIVTASFEVKNTGQADLRILSVKPG